MRRLIACALLAAALGSAGAIDLGALVGIAPAYSESGFSFSGGLSPWLSASLGGESELYLSADLDLGFEAEAWTVAISVERSELILRPLAGTEIHAGRFRFADEAGLAISGLYDGFSVATPLAGFAFKLGALYSGLQSKADSKVLLSGADIADLADDEQYFAPRRLLLSAGLSAPGTLGWYAQAIAQFDARGSGTLHSQYLVLGGKGSLSSAFDLDASLAGSLVEADGFDLSFAAAASAELGWMPPGAWSDRSYLRLRWASGDAGALSPYLSVNAIPQGKVFAPRLAGLTLAEAGYAARVLSTLSAELSSTAFLRSLEGGPADSGLDPSSDSPWLGFEAFASLRWAPYSDLNLGCGAGLFVPGTAFLSEEPLRWLVSTSLVVSL